MRRTSHVERRFATEHRILDKLAELLPVGEPRTGMNYTVLAEQIGEQAHAVLLAKKTMEDAGILETRLEYPKGQSGRVSVWELKMPPDLAHEELTREHELQLARPSQKAQRLARRGPAENGASPLSPVPVLRPEEAADLIQQARAHRNRIERALADIKSWRESGIEVDESTVTVRRDDKLEHIALVLPAVDELERERDRLGDQAERWRRKLIEEEEVVA